MVTDKQFSELAAKYDELNRKYTQMSRDIARIQMMLDMTKQRTMPTQTVVRKDKTRYRFQGQCLNKRQLVLSCLHQYVDDNPDLTAASFFEVFPDYVQGSMGVVRLVEEAEKYSDATLHYFFGDDEVIRLRDGIYAVSKDWTANNINGFIEIMQELGYEIVPMSRN